MSDPRTDQELISALNRADYSAFEPLYHRHKDWVYRLATRFTGDHDAALDVVQETFAYFVSLFPGFTLTAKLTTFLYPVVRNNALAARRRSRRLKFGAVPEQSAEGIIILPDTELGAILATLPAQQVEVLLMRVVDGLSVQEVANALQLAEGTVKSRLHTALEKLRQDPRAHRWFADSL